MTYFQIKQLNDYQIQAKIGFNITKDDIEFINGIDYIKTSVIQDQMDPQAFRTLQCHVPTLVTKPGIIEADESFVWEDDIDPEAYFIDSL